jgi:hypothetical protein
MSAASPISVAADFRIQQSDSKSSRHTTSSATTATTATTGHTHGHGHGLSNSNHTLGHDILNSSSSLIQVAVRIRPLMQFEHGNEACIQVFPNENELQTSLYKSTSNDSSMTWGANSTCTGTSKTGTASGNSGFGGFGGFGDSDAMQQPLTLSPSPSASSYQTLQIGEESDNHTYTFDHVFPSSTEQIEVYERCVTPLVESCLEGYNTTILAYGQTGAGKTHTILGNSSGTIDDVEGTLSNEGVIPRALKQIFNELDTVKEEAIRDASVREDEEGLDHEEPHGHDHDHLNNNNNNNSPKAHSRNESPFEYQVKIQFLELYGEDIRDLLDTTSNSNSNHNNNANDTESSPSPLSSPSSPSRNTNKKQSPRNIRRPKRILNRELSTASSMSMKSTRSTTTTKSQSTRSSASKNTNTNTSKSTLITIRDGRTGEDAEVLGIRKEKVTNANEALTLLTNGLSKRVVGKTAMNAHSSRSHAIFTVVVQQTRRKQSGIGGNAKTNVEMKTSKIHFVDLSGSERVKRSKTVGKRLVSFSFLVLVLSLIYSFIIIIISGCLN